MLYLFTYKYEAMTSAQIQDEKSVKASQSKRCVKAKNDRSYYWQTAELCAEQTRHSRKLRQEAGDSSNWSLSLIGSRYFTCATNQ